MRVSRNSLLASLPIPSDLSDGRIYAREITHRSFADAPDDRGLAVDKCATVMVPFSGNARFVCRTNGDRDIRGCYMISKRTIRKRDDPDAAVLLANKSKYMSAPLSQRYLFN